MSSYVRSIFLGRPLFLTLDTALSFSIITLFTDSFSSTYGSRNPIWCSKLMLLTIVWSYLLSKPCGLFLMRAWDLLLPSIDSSFVYLWMSLKSNTTYLTLLRPVRRAVASLKMWSVYGLSVRSTSNFSSIDWCKSNNCMSLMPKSLSVFGYDKISLIFL